MMRMVRHIRNHWAMSILFCMVFIALFLPFLANDVPILAEKENRYISPAGIDWFHYVGLSSGSVDRHKNYDKVYMYPPIRHNPEAVDITESLEPPMSGNHLLGTDVLGRDVAAGMLGGLSVALKIGIGGVALALIIGLLVGGLAGLKTESYFEMNLIQAMILFFILIMLLFQLYYGDHQWLIAGFWMATGSGLLYLASKLPLRRYTIPISQWMDGLIKLRDSIPDIFLVLGMIGLFHSYALINIVLILGFIGWGSIARYVRGEMIRIRALPYYQSSEAMGTSLWRKWIYHFIPNALESILSTLIFTVASFILIEASLSFLGIGLPPEIPTWGSLLAMARESNAWWLAIFPGLAILLIISLLNAWSSEVLRKRRGASL